MWVSRKSLGWHAVCMVLCALLLHATGRDSQGGTWTFGAGASFSSSPYKGYDVWNAMPILGYNGEYVYIKGSQAGVRVSPWDFLELSAFVEYDPTSFHTEFTQNDRLQHLNERYEGLLAGIGARVNLPFGGVLGASLASDVLARSNGLVANVAFEYPLVVSQLTILPSVGGKWFSKEYMDYYFGVSASESSRSGLKRYEATDGITPYGGLKLLYNVDADWSVSAGCEAFFLPDSVVDSPMVDKNVTLATYAAILYAF